MKRAYRNTNSSDAGQQPAELPGFEHINRYWDVRHDIYAAKILPGEFYVSMHGELITTVLGSCVSACVRDPDTGVGGMNHFMLPDNQARVSKEWEHTPVNAQTRYGNIAMERLINVVLASGCKRENVEIKLFGGAKVLNLNTDIGDKNVRFVKMYLATEGFTVLSEDVGGVFPRKVQYFPLTGRVRVKKLNTMHNSTLSERERDYSESLKKERIAGKIDLF